MEGSGPIGLSLMVVIAQIYMDYTIEKALKLAKKQKIKRPLALHAYMDDTFGIIIQNEEKIEHLNFLKCLNKVHPALKFTCEIEKNSRISFLDTLIIKEENGFLNTTVYRKSSNTGLTINPKTNQGPNTWIGVLKGVETEPTLFAPNRLPRT